MNTPIGAGKDTWTNALAKLAESRRIATERLASGRRINRAADDASGMAMAQRLAAEIRSAAQAERNLDDGRSMTRVAEGALQSSHNTLARMRELAIQARNGTLSDQDRANVQIEFDQLAAQLDQTAGSTRFAGKPLLDGSASGADAIEITDGEGGSTRIDLQSADATTLDVAGRDVAGAQTIAAIDEATAMLSSERAQLGAIDSQLGRQQSAIGAERVAASEARSRIEDADIAREMADAVRDRILARLQVAGQRIAQQMQSRMVDELY